MPCDQPQQFRPVQFVTSHLKKFSGECILDLLAVMKGRKDPFYPHEKRSDGEKVIEVKCSRNFTVLQAEAGKHHDYAY